jgi:hypothetical protein
VVRELGSERCETVRLLSAVSQKKQLIFFF